MSLENLVGGEKETIVLKNGKAKFDVYPLTIKDIGILIKKYSQRLEKFKGKDIDFMSLLEEAPEMVEDILKMGTRDEVKDVGKLAVGIQIRALDVIWTLSELDADYLGKLGARLLGVLKQTGLSLTPMMGSENGKEPSQELLKNSLQGDTVIKT